MELKPSKGLKVKVNATREVVFEDEALSVKKVSLAEKSLTGEMTGVTLAGYSEVLMPALDGKKHWYPIDSLEGENGEKIVEEEIEIDLEEDEGPEEE
jgi:hypothetical protein